MSHATTPEPPPKVGTGDVWMEVINGCCRWFPGFNGAAWEAYYWWLMFGTIPDGDTVDGALARMPPGLQRDMIERRWFGIKKHGTPLQRENERRHWVDAYQEALDLVAYAWAANGPWWLRWGAVAFAWAIRRRLPAM